MEITIEINCVRCESKKLVKNGKSRSGEQRFLCKDCGKTQQLKFQRKGDDPEKKKQIV